MRIRTKAKIRLVDFIRPGNLWPYPYTVEQAFMVFFHLAKTTGEYIVHRDSGPVDTLNCQPSCQFGSIIKPIISLADLKQRFQYALLCDEETGRALRDRWRAECGIGLDTVSWLRFPHLVPFHGGDSLACEADIKEAVDRLLVGTIDSPLAAGPDGHDVGNPTCHGCQVDVCRDGFSVTMKYGHTTVADMGSQWRYPLAESRPGEPFTLVLERAVARFAELAA